MDDIENTYDDNAIYYEGRRVYEDIGLMRLVVDNSSELVEQPLEVNASVIDHKITLLTKLTFLCILSGDTARDTYAAIKSDYIEGRIFSIKTSLEFYDSMVIGALPYQVDSSAPDRFEVLLSFTEYRYFESALAELPPASVANDSNSSTVNRGTQRGTEVAAAGSDEDASLLERILFGEDD